MKNTTKLVILSLLLTSLPYTTFASHTYKRISTSSLGKEKVEEIQVPVLFGVNLDKLVPDFGDPRGDGTRTHEGQDIRAPKGTPIISPTKAVVSKVGTETSAGKFVYTLNPGGESFRYMHLDSIEVKVGDKLEVGDIIGTVGDTGNAPDGIYHLHFEILDGRTPADPYPRLVDKLTLKEKASFLDDIFDEVKDEDELAKVLVDNYSDDLKEALEEGYVLPKKIEILLGNSKVSKELELLKALETLIRKIPEVLTMELAIGDQGTSVSLLQLYLIHLGQGSARNDLADTGTTGYYGTLTKSTILEYQQANNLPATGIYDSVTRLHMIK